MHKQPLVLSILFATISFCCAFIMAFPLFHSLLETSICPWYALEFFLRSLLLLLVCILAGILAHTKKLPLYLAVGIGSIFCVATLLGSLFSSYCNANTLNLFSAINRFYKLLCAVWILFISIPVLFQHKPFSRLIYSAVLVFSLSLIAEFSIPLFEPIHFGWFSEIAAIFLVLILGVVLWTSIIEQYRTSIQLTE